MIAGYRQFNDLLDEAYGSESQEDIDHFKSLTEGLKDSIFETAQELQEQQSNIADYYNTIKDIPYDDLTTEQKGIVDSYNSISDAIELIYQQLDSNTWKSMQIESVLDTDGVEKTKEELIEMVKAGEFDESNLQSYPKLSAALEQNKVSASELRNELEALAEAEGNVKGDTFNDKYPISLSITDTIDQLNTQLKPAFDSLQSAYQDIFTDDGFTLENVDTSMLSSIKSTIDELNNMEDVDINIDYSSFENLAKVLTDTSSESWQVQDAFDEFATTIVNSLNPAISQCDGESYRLLQTLLESMGIVNAEEVMVSSLGYTYEEYIAAKEEAADAGFDLANATESEIDAFVREALESDNCGQALALLQLKKLLVNSTSVNTAADIQQIMNLASAAGMGTEVLTQLANAKSILGTVEAGGSVSLNSYQKALDDVQSAKQSMLDRKPVEVDFGNIGGGKKSAGSAGKEAADAYLEAFEKELADLDDLKSRGKITEKQYLDALRRLYLKYFRDKEKYLKEYEKYEHQYLDGGLHAICCSNAA